jgi:hypothetical protein
MLTVVWFPPCQAVLETTPIPVQIMWVASTLIPQFVPATSDWGLVHSPRRSDGNQGKDGPLAYCPPLDVLCVGR